MQEIKLVDLLQEGLFDKVAVAKIENGITKAFSKMGIVVTPDNKIKATSRFARFLCQQAVKDGDFKQLDKNTFLVLHLQPTK